MANNCLDWKSKDLIELAKEVGVESTPAFADKVGTWLDNNPSESNDINIESINNDFDSFRNDDLNELNKKVGNIQKNPTELCEFTLSLIHI